jgi:hypothetical protein
MTDHDSIMQSSFTDSMLTHSLIVLSTFLSLIFIDKDRIQFQVKDFREEAIKVINITLVVHSFTSRPKEVNNCSSTKSIAA